MVTVKTQTDMVNFKMILRNVPGMVLGSLVLLLWAFGYGCKKQEPEPLTPIVVEPAPHTPTALEAAFGLHTGGHCHYQIYDLIQQTHTDTTFNDGAIKVTRKDDEWVSASGFAWYDFKSFRMPVESTDTIFFAVDHTTSESFSIVINTSGRTISTHTNQSYPTMPFEYVWDGLWKY